MDVGVWRMLACDRLEERGRKLVTEKGKSGRRVRGLSIGTSGPGYVGKRGVMEMMDGRLWSRVMYACRRPGWRREEGRKGLGWKGRGKG